MAEYKNPYQDKINKDKKALIKLTAGTANQQLINAAYLGARQEPPEAQTWLNAAESGLTSFKNAVTKSRLARELKEEKMNANIDTQINDIITSGYSLGQTYYTEANKYTEDLRGQYIAADGNPAEQQKLKMELNLASKSIQAVKTQIQSLSDAWGKDDESSMIERSNLPPHIQNIMMACTKEENAIWDKDKRTFKWTNPNYQKTGDDGKPLPGADKEFYTLEDMQNVEKLYSRDFDGSLQYQEDELKERQAGLLFKQGESNVAFNREKKMLINEKRITKENIHFYLNGDFTGDGTSFKEDIVDHPEWDDEIFKYFENIVNESGGMRYDTAEPYGVITIDDFEGANRIEKMEKVYNAITDSSAGGFDFTTSKNLIAEYMTLRQEQHFYGETVKMDDDTLWGFRGKDLDVFINAGGNLGAFKGRGVGVKNGKITIDKTVWDNTKLTSQNVLNPQ